MKFFKIIKDNTKFIGVGDSKDLRCFQEKHKIFLHCKELKAQYILCNGQLYRDYWMSSINNSTIEYVMANVIEIDEEEYNNLKAAISNNEEVSIQGSEGDSEPAFMDKREVLYSSVEIPTLEYVKESKIKEMSSKCKKEIISGIDITFPNKINEHFDLTIEDQLNLNSLRYKLNQGENYLIYHSKGGNFTYYTREEIQLILEAADKHILYHNAYFNSLKHYINSLTDYIIASKIEYGQEIPELYKSEVLKSLENKF